METLMAWNWIPNIYSNITNNICPEKKSNNQVWCIYLKCEKSLNNDFYKKYLHKHNNYHVIKMSRFL